MLERSDADKPPVGDQVAHTIQDLLSAACSNLRERVRRAKYNRAAVRVGAHRRVSSVVFDRGRWIREGQEVARAVPRDATVTAHKQCCAGAGITQKAEGSRRIFDDAGKIRCR